MKKYFSIIMIIAVIASLSACSVVEAKKMSSVPTMDIIETTEQSSSGEEKTTASESTTKLITTTVATTIKEVLSTTEKNITTASTKAVESTRVKTTKAETATTKAVKKLPDYYPEGKALELFEMINDYREANGARRLVLDETLCKLAYIRAEEQIEQEGHTRPDGTMAWSVCYEYGYAHNNFGENIAIGTDSTSERMMNGLRNSPGHNENMLRRQWERIGVGMYTDENGRDFYAMLFVY